MFKKNSDLYLRKIHISFVFKKKFRSESKEDTDQFCVKKKKNFRSASKEDTNQFCV